MSGKESLLQVVALQNVVAKVCRMVTCPWFASSASLPFTRLFLLLLIPVCCVSARCVQGFVVPGDIIRAHLNA